MSADIGGTDSGTSVYTVHDLSDHAARVMAEVAEAGKPAFITSFGRFVAVITPLGPGEVESRVLAEMARELSRRGNVTAA